MQEKKFTKVINGRKCYGTKFQLAVWKEIAKITPGKTKTYSELANILGKPKSARAVANACGKNPYPGPIACHRVIRSCLLYTSPSPRDGLLSRMPSSA